MQDRKWTTGNKNFKKVIMFSIYYHSLSSLKFLGKFNHTSSRYSADKNEKKINRK